LTAARCSTSRPAKSSRHRGPSCSSCLAAAGPGAAPAAAKQGAVNWIRHSPVSVVDREGSYGTGTVSSSSSLIRRSYQPYTQASS
jgi:hypothetical protein